MPLVDVDDLFDLQQKLANSDWSEDRAAAADLLHMLTSSRSANGWHVDISRLLDEHPNLPEYAWNILYPLSKPIGV